MDLRVRGDNIRVLSPGKLTRWGGDTGNPAQEIPVPAGHGTLIPLGDELLEFAFCAPGCTQRCAGEEEWLFQLTKHAAILAGLGQDGNRQFSRVLGRSRGGC